MFEKYYLFQFVVVFLGPLSLGGTFLDNGVSNGWILSHSAIAVQSIHANRGKEDRQ
jgi:hypothetical protein